MFGLASPALGQSPIFPPGLLAAAAAAAANGQNANGPRPVGPYGFPGMPFQRPAFDLASTQALLNIMRSNANARDLTSRTVEADRVKRPREEDENEGMSEKKQLIIDVDESSVCNREPCSDAARHVSRWTVDQVAEFLSSTELCAEYGERFRSHSIDGATLLLLTESHLADKLGMKLGPMIKLRRALAEVTSSCPKCFHCKNCHRPKIEDDNEDDDNEEPIVD